VIVDKKQSACRARRGLKRLAADGMSACSVNAPSYRRRLNVSFSAARSIIFLSCCVLSLASSGCSERVADEPRTTAEKRLNVFVGIAPLADIVERIGGPTVDVHVLLPPGQDPHTFELSPRQVAALNNAKAFFYIGMPFEEQIVSRIAGSPRRPEIIDAAQGVVKRDMEDREHLVAEKNDEDKAHGADAQRRGLDPHVWLSPQCLKIISENVARSLERLDPDNARAYVKNLIELIHDIDATDEKIKKMLEPLRGRTFFVFHPAFGYFADAYGLKQEAVEAGGKQPTPRQLLSLIDLAKRENIKTIFAQPQFDPHSAETIAGAIGGRVVPLDDLAKDVLCNLTDIAEKIRESFK
jgi:zinc transport system substrate-binding protein